MRKKSKRVGLVPAERIEQQILLLRGQNVMLDMDLAELYGVQTKVLNQAVKRNVRRFPEDFMFRLTPEETRELNRSQSVTGSQKHRDPRYPPYAFAEQGVAMLSSVLNSDQAIDVNVAIIRSFVRLRKMLSSHKDLARKLAGLEKKYDHQFKAVFDAIRQLMEPPPARPKRRIGFRNE
jgi:hypothetical protein